MTLKHKQFREIITFGNSMYPLLLNGDVIHFKKTSFSKIKVDDLIGIIRNKTIINHRVVYKTDHYLITKGDNNLSLDSPTRPEKIIGKISLIKRRDRIFSPGNLYLSQSINYFSEITKIKRVLEKNRINFIFIKGLPVNLYYQKTHPRRIYADCDILIDSKESLQVEEIFISLGYKRKNIIRHPLLDFVIKNKVEYECWKQIGPFRIVFDIHLQPVFFFVQTNNLSPLYPKKLIINFTDLLIKNKRFIKIEKEKYPLLSKESQIAYLALHLFHDNFAGYHKYMLLEKVINSGNFKEQEVIKIINQHRLNNYLYPVFALLNKYYRPKLSKNFLKQISPERKKLNQIKSVIKNTDIFEGEEHTRAAVRRFKNIYSLSPCPGILKPLVFLNFEIISLILYVVLKRFKNLLRYYLYLLMNKSSHLRSKKEPLLPAIADQSPSAH